MCIRDRVISDPRARFFIGIGTTSGWNLVVKIGTAGKVIVPYHSIRAHLFSSTFENSLKIEFFEFYYETSLVDRARRCQHLARCGLLRSALPHVTLSTRSTSSRSSLNRKKNIHDAAHLCHFFSLKFKFSSWKPKKFSWKASLFSVKSTLWRRIFYWILL